MHCPCREFSAWTPKMSRSFVFAISSPQLRLKSATPFGVFDERRRRQLFSWRCLERAFQWRKKRRSRGLKPFNALFPRLLKRLRRWRANPSKRASQPNERVRPKPLEFRTCHTVSAGPPRQKGNTRSRMPQREPLFVFVFSSLGVYHVISVCPGFSHRVKDCGNRIRYLLGSRLRRGLLRKSIRPR
jgi:hypothetical protein